MSMQGFFWEIFPLVSVLGETIALSCPQPVACTGQGGCDVAPTGDLRGGQALPPLEFRPLLGIPGGVLPTVELVQGGGKVLDDQDLSPPLGKSCPSP